MDGSQLYDNYSFPIAQFVSRAAVVRIQLFPDCDLLMGNDQPRHREDFNLRVARAEAAPNVEASANRTMQVKEEQNFYDMILPCRLQELCDDKQGNWKLKLYRPPGGGVTDLDQWVGHVIGVLGHYNRGKTYVMGRLSDYTFPTESTIIRTEGMSFKWIETKKEASSDHGSGDVRWHLAIDTAGFNAPISFDKNESPTARRSERTPGIHSSPTTERRNESVAERLKRKSCEKAPGKQPDSDNKAIQMEVDTRIREIKDNEQFLGSMTLTLSNYLLVVMNETSLQEYGFLLDVVKRWGDYKTHLKSQDVFVIHNFKTIENADEREELFLQSTSDIYEGRMSKVGDVSFFCCPNLSTRHVCLMRDVEKECQAYNAKVFSLLKAWIHNILSPPVEPCTPEVMTDMFAEEATNLLSQRGYLTNISGIMKETKEEEIIYVAKKLDDGAPITMTVSSTDKFYSNMQAFKPEVCERDYKAKEGSKCKVLQLEAPGVTKLKAKVNNEESVRGCWAVDVRGTKTKHDFVKTLCQQPKLKDKTRLLPEEDQELTEPKKDSCRYGEFEERLQIEMKFRKPKWRTLGPINGLFYLIFEEDEEEEDSD
jgi:hypothetical protein